MWKRRLGIDVRIAISMTSLWGLVPVASAQWTVINMEPEGPTGTNVMGIDAGQEA